MNNAPYGMNLIQYKTQPCSEFYQTGKCNNAHCPFFHNYGDRRRPPIKEGLLQYQNILCPHVSNFTPCPHKDNCQLAHNTLEIKYHPDTINTPPRELSPFPVSANATKVDSIDIMTFKTKECTNGEPHDQKYCMYFHSLKDKRRVPTNYSSEKCQFFNDGNCPLKDMCPKSHNRMERLYHPEKYKTSFCNDFFQPNSNCSYGAICCFAHSENDVLIELIHKFPQDEEFFMYHFKTVWCPFNFEHNKALCLYAHNWQDYRRKPHLFEYYNQPCPNWKSEVFLCSYSEGCPNQANCKYCHGWKEQQYHPFEYKTKPCPEGKKCSRGGKSACPFFHSYTDMRSVETINKQSLYPKNYALYKRYHPHSSINDQKELYLKMKASSLEEPPVLKLKYTIFEDDERITKKVGMYEAQHKPVLSVNSKSFIPKSVKERLNDELGMFLSSIDCIHLYFNLSGRLNFEDKIGLNGITQEELFAMGVTSMEENEKVYRAIKLFVTS